MVKTQYNSKVIEWMSDGGGEYIDKDYERLLKSKGIKIGQSIPHQPQMNGQSERFNRTIDEKSQSMCFDACLPQNWWEFSVLHAVYRYNCTPM